VEELKIPEKIEVLLGMCSKSYWFQLYTNEVNLVTRVYKGRLEKYKKQLCKLWLPMTGVFGIRLELAGYKANKSASCSFFFYWSRNSKHLFSINTNGCNFTVTIQKLFDIQIFTWFLIPIFREINSKFKYHFNRRPRVFTTPL